MNNVNNVAYHGPDDSRIPAVTIPLSQDVADSLRKSPLPMRVIFYAYLMLLFVGVGVLVLGDTENLQQYRSYGIIAFIFTFPLRIALKKVFLGRAVGSVSDELTQKLGQSASFRKIVHETLMQTPWSKHRLSKGRYKEARFEDIMVLFRDGSHTNLSLARDFSSISIVPPARII